MSIYVLNLESNQVDKIYAEHTSNIIGLSWSKTEPSKFVSAQSDQIYVWDLNFDVAISIVPISPAILSFEYDPFNSNFVVILLENGDVKLLDINSRILTKYNNYSAGKPQHIRCHPNVANKFALACSEGFVLIGCFDKRLVDRVEIENWKHPIEDLAWDPLSENYLLVAYREGTMFLFDTSSRVKLRTYERQTIGIKRIVWNKKRLGEFYTCDSKVANLKVWHVSKPAPAGVVKLGISGVKDMFLLEESQKMLCTYKDGAVSVYDLAQHRVDYSTEPGHSETIFDIALKPDDPNFLATCSYDGTIKIWDVLTMKNIETLESDAIEMGIYRRGMNIRRAVFYGLCWGSENYIAGCTSLGEVLLYDFKKNKLIHRLRVGPEAPIYRITWHPIENTIAVPTLDYKVNLLSLQHLSIPRPKIVFGVTRTIPTPGTEAIGVAFSPIEPKYLAIGCKDKTVQIIDTSLDVNEFTTLPPGSDRTEGHTKRVFNVAWSPLNKNWVASTSDDSTVIVWDIAQRKPHHVLKGHTSNVRPVVWSTEIEHLILSGSWDGTIKLWDLRGGECIYTATEHHADVYGLCSHPSRPFLYFSCSRDTSIRQWTIEDYIQQQLLESASGLDELTGNLYKFAGDSDPEPGGFLKFKGKKFTTLIDRLPQCSYIERWEQIASFFLFRNGERDFFDALKHVVNPSTRVTSTNQVLPFDELFKVKRSEAEDLVQSTSMRWLGGALAKKEDRLSKAANMFLRLGDFKGFCEIQIELGNYEKALAFAPRVSMEFWEQVAVRYAESLKQKNIEDAANYYLAVGKTEDAINFMTNRGDFREALFIAFNQKENRFVPLKYKPDDAQRPNEFDQLEHMAQLAAEDYFNTGHAILAATQLIVANNSSAAVDLLIRGDELFYALILAKSYAKTDYIKKIQRLLSKKAEKLKNYKLAVHFMDASEKQLGIVRLYGPDATRHFEEHKLPLEVEVRASIDGLSRAKDYVGVMKAQLILRDARAAYLTFTTNASSLFETPDGLLTLFEMVELLRSLKHQDSVDEKCELMALTSLIGGIHACYLGYSVAKALIGTCRNFVNWRSTLIAANLLRKIDDLRANCRDHELLPAIEETKSLFGGAEFSLPIRDIKLLGSNLPTSSQTTLSSAFTGKRITGPVYREESLVISKAEALMWAEVNPFSPLNSGTLINPY
mmetsp:Transcript_17137/g.30766  ORF Transcript_17137/g.30766 Transcript_17137/m.30766 type:complete len:1177 (-) Transcript_17137:8002-11532(-)